MKDLDRSTMTGEIFGWVMFAPENREKFKRKSQEFLNGEITDTHYESSVLSMLNIGIDYIYGEENKHLVKQAMFDITLVNLVELAEQAIK